MCLSLARSCAACVSVTFKVLEWFFMSMVPQKYRNSKIGLESVRQEQNVESEMVSRKVFRTGAVIEPSLTIYPFPLQFRSNDAVPEEA